MPSLPCVAPARRLTHPPRRGADQKLSFLLEAAASVQWAKLKELICTRCGDALPSDVSYWWIDPTGQESEIDSYDSFSAFIRTMWCALPWELHAIEGGDPAATQKSLKILRECACADKTSTATASSRARSCPGC